jgi:hypothetical protein
MNEVAVQYMLESRAKLNELLWDMAMILPHPMAVPCNITLMNINYGLKFIEQPIQIQHCVMH